MTEASSQTRIGKLLDAVIADFPRRKAAAESLIRRAELNGLLELEVFPAETSRFLPSFDPTRQRRFTPMLKARFNYASTIEYGGDTWLSVAEMRRWMRKRDVRSYHKALREYHEGSAPALFPDSDLTLLMVTKGVPDNLTYLVWSAPKDEPEIWSYIGWETLKFKDLSAFLAWILKRK